MSDLEVGRPFAAVVNSSSADVITGRYSSKLLVGDGMEFEVEVEVEVDVDPALPVLVALCVAIWTRILA
jgi:hypothetical protein